MGCSSENYFFLPLECQDLVCKILTTDPEKRATLQDIIRHPWMTMEEPSDEVCHWYIHYIYQQNTK